VKPDGLGARGAVAVGDGGAMRALAPRTKKVQGKPQSRPLTFQALFGLGNKLSVEQRGSSLAASDGG